MFFQRLAVVIGGFAAGALVRRWQAHDTAASRRSLDRLSREWKAQVRAHDQRLSRLEERSDEQEAKLKELPTTVQIVSAMDELLAKAMSGLDAALKKLNLGVSAWVTLSGKDGSQDGRSWWWKREFGYTKDKWGVALRTKSGDVDDPDALAPSADTNS